MQLFLLLIGVIGLWIGTELTIRGATSVARRIGMSEFVVGVAILSVGSDLPELTIAVSGAIENLQQNQTMSGVIVGSALGSGLAQIGFVLGVIGLLGYLTLPRRSIYQHGTILLASLVILCLVGIDGVVTRTEGGSLVVIYLIYFVFLLTEPRRGSTQKATETVASNRTWLPLIAGLVVVLVSAQVTLQAAIAVAMSWGIQDSVVAVIIIGLGTSLPELSISVAAVLKKRGGLSVGNLIGSNIFDTLVPVGVAALISELQFGEGLLYFDLPALFFISAMVLVFFHRTRGLQKREAALVLGAYCCYALLRVSLS